MEFNSHQVTEEMWISNLAKNPGLAMLLVNGFGKLTLLHNVSYLQENLFCNEAKILGLCGDDSQAEVYRIDPKSAANALEISAPAWRDLKGMQVGTDLDSLTVQEQTASITRIKNSLWIPPLVLTSVLEAKSLAPADLIPLLSVKFQ
jgi:hypothetical protein